MTLFKLVEFLMLGFVGVTADEGQRLKELLDSMGCSFELSIGFPLYSNEMEYKSDNERCDTPLSLIDSPLALCINESPKFLSPEVEENVVDGINPLANVEDNVKEEVVLTTSNFPRKKVVAEAADVIVCLENGCCLTFPTEAKMLAHLCISHSYRQKLTKMLPDQFEFQNGVVSKCLLCNNRIKSIPGACYHLGAYHNVVYELMRQEKCRKEGFS